MQKRCLMLQRLWGNRQGRATTFPSLWGTLPILLCSTIERIILFQPIKNVAKFHQFHVSADHPGVVECRELSDSPIVRITLRKVSKMNVNVSCDDLPKEKLHS
ncbi:hypothetical protein DPMN_075350 [Dreissena polymorpha]|uniref:Uncharacterized protein n=1 Tax=Dreissena polymorpha TaxID=45954 RepID=A0A9D3YKB6_DREPO|nr:hypothetical protein DPMN_075350 [Dreissena polymorpha]